MHSIFEYQLFRINEYAFTLAMLTGVVLVWVFTTLLLRAIRRVINREGGRILSLSDKGRKLSLYLLARYFIWTLAVIVMLEIVGIHISVLLAGSAALLVGLGLGVQQIFKDIVSGIFLLFEGTIEIGDIIELDGEVGRVEEISLRTSKLLTHDGQTMIVPNHKFITENVQNWTHQNGHPCAFRIQVRVANDTDERQVLAILQEAVASNSEIMKDEPAYLPQFRLLEFLEKQNVYEVKFWTQNKFEAEQIQSDLRLAIQAQIRAQGLLAPKV